MRYFLLIIMFLFASCQPQIEKGGEVIDYTGLLTKRDLAICQAIAKEYMPDATIYILPDQPLAYGILGLANQVADHVYLIQIHNWNKIPLETLFHEMGHLIDAERGRLDFRGNMTWDGKPCDWKLAWMDRPWEMSANQWRDCLRYEYKSGTLKHYNYFWELLPKNLNTYQSDSEY